MGTQTMGSQGSGGGSGSGSGGNNGKHSQLQGLARQNSIYSLTFDEVQNQLGDLGKPLGSMNLDELLKNVCTADASQYFAMDTEGTSSGNQANLQRQPSLSLIGDLSKKTVDEVWRVIQQNKNNEEKKIHERQPTLGEMTLEAFLVQAGIMAELSPDTRIPNPAVEVDPSIATQSPLHGQWLQYPLQAQFSHPSQSMMGAYIPAQALTQPLQMGAAVMMDAPYPDSQLALHSPLMGTSSDTQTSGRKRGASEDVIEKSVERRQKRMIKNRESAARSRARKQAYTNELEQKVSRLEQENDRLRKRKVFENMFPTFQPPERRYQLRRTSSAPF
ncbi:hypothetical protein SAY87_025914 [Trapa incisa]|uniref:BZIP domain-containing protein n=1 Tax=Trapa incisa TaxID=236973 RepID=A0AAN7H1Y3_9MYRT|nr:hypothetical protein SAY87_025914 [Trapa incisa]